jgi:hypothetical protein
MLDSSIFRSQLALSALHKFNTYGLSLSSDCLHIVPSSSPRRVINLFGPSRATQLIYTGSFVSLQDNVHANYREVYAAI